MSEPYHSPADAFSGQGAARYGGRWNPPGVGLVYTSASVSLAVLERLVHTRSVRGLNGLWLYTLELDEDECLYLPETELPPDWDRRPTPPDWHEGAAATQQLGAAWVGEDASLALRVPSVVVPQEYVYLVNPAHPSFDPADLAPAERFVFDPRLA